MVNKLQITAALRQERTILKDCFFTQPFRVANISEDRRDPTLYLMVMSSSPGLLSRDEYAIEINVEPGARLMLQSQAYQRIFTMRGSANIRQQISIGENATLFYVPHPVVPHKDSNLSAETTIRLQKGSRMMFSDILACGRKHSGESFLYTLFRNRVEIYYGSRLIYKDNVVIEPKRANFSGLGQFQGYSHQASFVVADSRDSTAPDLLDPLLALLNEEPYISFGITRAHEQLIAGRILGHSGEELYRLLKRMEQFLCRPDNQSVSMAEITSSEQMIL